MRLATTIVRLGMYCSVFACGRTPADDHLAVGVRDSAGVEIVTSSYQDVPTDSGWRVDSVPLTSIGGNERDPQQHFQYVPAAVRLGDGRVVVATQTDLRWFDLNGRYLKTSSRAGDGPGEFRHLSSLTRLEGDSVVAADGSGQRVSTFGPDGAFIREQRLDWPRFRALGRWVECQSALLPDGSRYHCASDPAIPVTASNRPSRQVSPGWTSPGVGHLRQLRRTFVIPPSLDTAYPLGIVAGIEQFGVKVATGRETFITHPFYARSLLAAGGTPMRIATMRNPEYRIEVWTPLGRLERVILLNGARRAPTMAERSEARGELLRRERRMIDPAMLASVIDAVPAPDSLPAADRLVISSTNEIIVTRDAWIPGVSRTRIDVFAATGQFIGGFHLRPRTVLYEVGPDYILAARLDDNDVPHIEVYRLRR